MSTPVFESFAVRADARAAHGAMATLPGEWRLQALSESLGEYEFVPLHGRKLSNGTAWETARRLAREPGILEAEPLFAGPGLQPDPTRLNDILAPHERPRVTRALGSGGKPLSCSDDPHWSVEAVNAHKAWSASTGQGVVIGHPDTGYTRHPQIWSNTDPRVLAGKGYDFVRDQISALDPLTGASPGHGSSTASVIMSARGGADGPQVDGIAPDAQLVPLRVSDSVIHVSFTNLRRALHFIAGKAQVITMSLGGPFPSQALRRALQHVTDLGAVCVAASGNVYPFVVYPARYAEVLAVAATNCGQKRWKWSTNGRAVDFSAPGESVWCATSTLHADAPVYAVERGSGTSFATATAAGVCALWIARHGHANLVARYCSRVSAVFREIVTRSGCHTPPGWNTRTMGAGIIDAQKVLAAPLPSGVVAPAGTAPRGTLESAIDYFPTLEPDVALAAITAKVPRTRRGGVRAAFDVAGEELLFQLGSSASLRAVIFDRATGGMRKRGTSRSGETAAKIDASAAFRRAFGV
jgi:serine protease